MYNPAGVYVASAYFSPGTHTRGYFVLFGAFWRAGNHGDGDDEGDAPLLPGFHRLSSLPPPPHTHRFQFGDDATSTIIRDGSSVFGLSIVCTTVVRFPCSINSGVMVCVCFTLLSYSPGVARRACVLVAHVSARGGQVVGTAGSCSGWWLGEVGIRGCQTPLGLPSRFLGIRYLELP